MYFALILATRVVHGIFTALKRRDCAAGRLSKVLERWDYTCICEAEEFSLSLTGD